MNRALLPSEQIQEDRIVSGEWHIDSGIWEKLECSEESIGFEPCKEIQRLCKEYHDLACEKVAQIWHLLRMPFAPASMVSGLAAAGAAAKIIPQEVAYAVAGISTCYSGWKGIHFLSDRSALNASMETTALKIRLNLPQIAERDLLLVRAMIDEIPEVRDRCSEW